MACLELSQRGSIDATAVAGWMLFVGIGSSRQMGDAEILLEKARRGGSAYATFGLAWLNYERGLLGQCHVLMQEAADRGFLPAILDLGRIYFGGIGIKRDDAKAEHQYWQAVRRGHRMAPVLLLRLWTFGRCGVAKAVIGTLTWWPVRVVCILRTVIARFDENGLFYTPTVNRARSKK
jgi:TPR repeat protein